MCGIVGYTGAKQASEILLDALEHLEYRGYDSAGLAVHGADGIHVEKARGRLSALRKRVNDGVELSGTVGIGHTRWATHGEPSDLNAHPHASTDSRVVIVHNGIIENYLPLQEFLATHGYTFKSQTDSEVVANLIDYYYHGDPVEAVRTALIQIKGSYALGVLFTDQPDLIVAARKNSPLIIGRGKDETFIASDVPAILKYTRRVVRLKEMDVAVIRAGSLEIYDPFGVPVSYTEETIDWDVSAAEKGGYEHFMLKEIYEQPRAIRDTISPRVTDGNIELGLHGLDESRIRTLKQIYITACGSSYHVGMVGRVFMERLLKIPVRVELASEFRYDDPLVDADTLVLVISQSGETADTLAALREAKRLGAFTLGIVNVVGSAIATEADEVLYTWAGPEIAVATTKAYNTQLSVLYLLTLSMSRALGRLDDTEYTAYMHQLKVLPDLCEKLLQDTSHLQYLASLCFAKNDIFFIGRNLDYALALEGSLKLKEISYIHSESYAAGELKHGTISLIQPGSLVIALCTQEKLLERMISDIRTVKSRGAMVIALACEGTPFVDEVADHVIRLPSGADFVAPSLSVVPLQLFAYYVASLKGCDIDKPRNLAKSVTVE